MFLGHRDNDNDRSQSLYDHCHNVGEIAGNNGRSIQIESLMKLAGLLHDQGKATDDYVAYFFDEHSRKLNHSSAGAQYIYENFYKEEKLQNLTAQLLSSIICSHHSGLLDEVDLDYNDKFTERMKAPLADKDVVYRNYTKEVCSDEELRKLFEQAKKEIKNIMVKVKRNEEGNLYFQFGLFVRYCFSLLIDADYYDTACFFDEKELQCTPHNNQYLFAVWKDTLESYINRNFGSAKSNTINQYRSEISVSCLNAASKKPGIYRLFVPTGGGKTLSGLRFALTHAVYHTQMNRIFYVAPYLTILRQNGKEISSILNEPKDDLHILEHFSDIVDDTSSDEQDKDKKKLYTERWDAPFVITSMVQFLNTLFSGNKTSVRRMQSLSNSIIILDEVQTLPPKVTYMFNQAMNFLKNVCNCTIILCSATQPTFNNMDYNIEIDGDIVEDYQNKFLQFQRVNVHDCTIPGGYQELDLIQLITDKLKYHQSALIIMNTKKAVIDVYESLWQWNQTLPESEQYKIHCLSNNECLNHRTDILNMIEKELGKEKVICVSTSLIEAGVDISFEICFRDCTGLDSIAQAAGRCNRHKELEKGEVFIVNYENENIRKLENVFLGKTTSINLLHAFKIDPAMYDHDLLSPKMMDAYYEAYYSEIKQKLAYPSKHGSDLLDYLSDFGRKRVNLPLTQAFATAGKEFKVIDEDTIDILVPYREGEDMIAELLSKDIKIEDVQLLLKKLQPYTISVYRNALQKNKIPCTYLESYGIYVLEGGYDDQIGLTEHQYSANFI